MKLQFPLSTLVLAVVCASLVVALVIERGRRNAAEARADAATLTLWYEIRNGTPEVSILWKRLDGTEFQSNLRDGQVIRLSIESQEVLQGPWPREGRKFWTPPPDPEPRRSPPTLEP